MSEIELARARLMMSLDALRNEIVMHLESVRSRTLPVDKVAGHGKQIEDGAVKTSVMAIQDNQDRTSHGTPFNATEKKVQADKQKWAMGMLSRVSAWFFDFLR